MNELLYKYVQDSEDFENNYNLGIFYENINQTASALSFYLRASERTENVLLQYECLLRSSICFDKQGNRNFTTKGLLQHALAIQPKRPECYYLLSRFYEKEKKDGNWQDCYTICSMGLVVCDFNLSSLRTNVEYPGSYGILFQKALAAWNCGLKEESKKIFIDLYENYQLNDTFKSPVINNLKFLGVIN